MHGSIVHNAIWLLKYIHFFTVSVFVRITVLPLFGSKMTTIVHFPVRIPFSELPTKAQYCLPFVMLIRIVPTDRFGMLIDTDAASFAALTFNPRRIAMGRISGATFGAAIATANITGAAVVVVDVVVVGSTAVDGTTVDGTTVVGTTVVGTTVVGAAVVVVGTTLRVAIAVAVATSDCVPIPN